MPKSDAWVQLIDPLVTPNRLVFQSPFFFPASLFFLGNVVLLSLHFLSTYMQDAPAYLDYFLDIDVILELFHIGLDAFWFWFK